MKLTIWDDWIQKMIVDGDEEAVILAAFLLSRPKEILTWKMAYSGTCKEIGLPTLYRQLPKIIWERWATYLLDGTFTSHSVKLKYYYETKDDPSNNMA